MSDPNATGPGSVEFCRRCTEERLSTWRGWPHTDAIPLLPRILAGACQACGGATAIRNPNIAWQNYHSKFNTGLPDYWLLVITERPNKWGLPYFAVGECPRCGNASVISQMRFPDRTHELKHNCERCGVVDAC